MTIAKDEKSAGTGTAALTLMEQALDLLDHLDGGDVAAAQLDLAICRLQSLLGIETAGAERPNPFEQQLWDDGPDSFAA